MVRIKVKVGPKGQIVIPKVFRDEYNISYGDDLIMKENNQVLMIEKPIENIVEKLENFAKKIKIRNFDVHEIEKEYEERWKKSRNST